MGLRSVRFSGDWQKALELSRRGQDAVGKALAQEADYLADRMREGLASGSPAGTALAPLHPLTAALKGSQIPLAGMERWVQSAHVGPLRYFVGFRDPEGIRIGLIHEEGRTWSMYWTDRQRRWFFAQMSRFGLLDKNREPTNQASGGEITYQIPARPWLAPIVNAYLPGARERITAAVVKAVLG